METIRKWNDFPSVYQFDGQLAPATSPLASRFTGKNWWKAGAGNIACGIPDGQN